MNWAEHAVIGGGTACAAIWAAQQAGVLGEDLNAILLGGLAAGLGAVAVDIDHPQAFVSRGLPRQILSALLPLLLVPLLLAVLVARRGGDAGSLLSGWEELIHLALVGGLVAAGLVATSYVVSKTLGHRGPLHSVAFSLLVTAASCAVAGVALGSGKWWSGLCFGWGWLSHVLADSLTSEGVPLRWPFG